jgi:murE/murF fusion protein
VRTITFGLHGTTCGRAVGIRHGRHPRSRVSKGLIEIASPLVGEHNVMNLLGAIGVGLALDMEPRRIGETLSRVATVPGRFERVEAGQPFLVVVDYAHTPDALERVLTTARKLLRPGGRLGVVFGCGGDRDRGKRPIMGGIATRLADFAWVTSDNPRTERPEAILTEIETGIPAEAAGRHESMADRRRAIEAAAGWGRAGDVVVIAGKGHETYQIIGPTHAFDDRAVARAGGAGAEGDGRAGEDVVRGTQGALVGGDLGVPVSGVSIDTRTLPVGTAFFAIQGQNDGHRFLTDAVARGAACLVVHALPDDLPATVAVVLVDETTRALGRLAAYHRARFTLPVAAVTGSNGKTTTKEMMAAVLEGLGPVLKPRPPSTTSGVSPHRAPLTGPIARWAGGQPPGEIARWRHRRPGGVVQWCPPRTSSWVPREVHGEERAGGAVPPEV